MKAMSDQTALIDRQKKQSELNDSRLDVIERKLEEMESALKIK